MIAEEDGQVGNAVGIEVADVEGERAHREQKDHDEDVSQWRREIGREFAAELLDQIQLQRREKVDKEADDLSAIMADTKNRSPEEAQQALEQYLEMNIVSFKQDVAIWDNKVRVDNPLLCDGDGPVHMLRKWYSQFYMDVADIPADITRYKKHVTLE